MTVGNSFHLLSKMMMTIHFYDSMYTFLYTRTYTKYLHFRLHYIILWDNLNLSENISSFGQQLM